MNFEEQLEEYKKEHLRTTGAKTPDITVGKTAWFQLSGSSIRKGELPDMTARLKARPDARFLGRVERAGTDWIVKVPYLGEMVKWQINPAQVAALDIDVNLEIRVNAKKQEAPFCHVIEVVEPYGHCAVCRKRFIYGEKHLRVSVIQNYTSQGQPDQYEKLTTNYHPHCLTEDFVHGICEAEIVNQKS